MQITNNSGLPETLYLAVANNRYSNGGADYSASDLVNPVQQVILKKRYWSQLSEDVSECIYQLFGNMIHDLLARQDLKDALQEERLHTVVLDKKLSGQPDMYRDGKVSDYKLTSVFSWLNGSRLKEWEQQLNIYAFLLRLHGFEVNELEIVVMFRDWSAAEGSRYGSRYPRKAECIKMPLWTMKEQQEYVEAAIGLLKLAEPLTDDQLPPCSDEDIWAKPDQFAVYKIGGKNASKLEDTQAAAQAYIDRQKKPAEYEIRHRPGAHTRCENYCAVRDFCSQHMTWCMGKDEGGEQVPAAEPTQEVKS